MVRFLRLFGKRGTVVFLLMLAFASVAQALAPLLLLPPAIEVLTGVMTMKNFLAASVGAHAAVALIWGNKDGSSNPATTRAGGQITVYIDPKKPLVAPSGWSEGTPGTSNSGTNPQPSPPPQIPATQTPFGCSIGGYSGSGSTPEAACGSALTAFINGSGTTRSYVLTGCSPPTASNPSTSTCSIDRDGAPWATFTASSQVGCPQGYTADGNGGCTLTDPAQVQKPADQNCSIVRTGNTFGIDAQDPDCATTPATMITPSTIQLKKNNEIMEATINADGSVTTKMTGPDASGNTESTTINFASPSNSMGMPSTGTSTTTTQGSGDLNNPGVPLPPKLDLPTDYNREPTQQQINTKLGEIKDSLNPNDPGPDTTLDAQKNDYDAKATAHKGVFDGIGGKGQSNEGGIFGWAGMPAVPTGSCAAINFGTSAYTTSFDVCPILDKIRDLAGYALYIYTAWALFGILTGRQTA